MAVHSRKNRNSSINSAAKNALRTTRRVSKLQDKIHADFKEASRSLGFEMQKAGKTIEAFNDGLDLVLGSVSETDIDAVIKQAQKENARDLALEFPNPPTTIPEISKSNNKQPAKKPAPKKAVTKKQAPKANRTLRQHMKDDASKAQYKQFHNMVNENANFYNKHSNRANEAACYKNLKQSVKMLAEFYGKDNPAVKTMQSKLGNITKMRGKKDVFKSSVQLKESQLAQSVQKAMKMLKTTVARDAMQKFGSNNNNTQSSTPQPRAFRR